MFDVNQLTEDNLPWRWVRIADYLRENDPDQLEALEDGYEAVLNHVYNMTGGIGSVPDPQLVDQINVTGYTDPINANGSETVQLSVEVLPPNADVKTVTWSSDDEAVATVDAGEVTAVSEGEAVITATANDGSGTTGSVTVGVIDTTV